jgi:hypothetical protein
VPLPLVPLDSENDKQHRTIIATVLNELAKQAPQSGSWTAVIRGSTLAGTYEIASQLTRYTRIGRRVWLDFYIVMAAAITAGGTGSLQITGLPYAKAADTLPVGPVSVDGYDTSANANLVVTFAALTASSILNIREYYDNAGANGLAITGIAANDIINGSICYETDDP